MYRALSAGLVAVSLLTPAIAGAADSDTYRQLNLFGDVFERVRSDYVEAVSDQELIENAVNGMLTALDPHSSYMNADAFKDMQVQTRGEFGGLGIEVTMEEGLVKVVSPIDETPAFRAGLQPNDLITHIDGTEVLGMTLAEAVDLMRGPVATDIRITVRRAEQPPFDVTITRDVIHIKSVRSRLEGNIGYVRITSFNEQTESGLIDAVDKLKKDSGDLRGVVLDLRNNPGGLLDQAVAVSDAFLDQGEIVSTRGRRPDSAQRYNAKSGDITGGLPMVVLINGGSASASEIVAGALKDHQRAVILGTTSFGKGSVQTIIPLAGNGAIRLTTARYYTPSGSSIQATGIHPDIVVEQAKIEPVASTLPRTREGDLRGHLLGTDEQKAQDQQGTAPAQEDAKAPESADEAAPATQTADAGQPIDYQLERALDLLRGLSLFGNKA
tara:strand:- start:181 stop:1500 length:1320 start_codon:yes stop_codon:yes gene_type:complete